MLQLRAGLPMLLAIAWLRLRPAGSLFHIFAIASIVHQPPLWQAMLAAVLTTAFALVVGLSSRILPTHRTPWTRPPRIRRTTAEKRLA